MADAGYYAKNNQGEIWLKGGPVVSEYYKNERKLKKLLLMMDGLKLGILVNGLVMVD